MDAGSIVVELLQRLDIKNLPECVDVKVAESLKDQDPRDNQPRRKVGKAGMPYRHLLPTRESQLPCPYLAEQKQVCRDVSYIYLV
jgi:hypothetical protein